MTATLSRRTGIYMSSQSSYNDANDKLVSNNHPQLEGKMWTIFPTDLKCRVYVSLSNPLWLIISNTVRHTNYVRT